MSNLCVISPFTGSISFGVVPKIKVPGLICEPAEIHLFERRQQHQIMHAANLH